MRTSIRLAAAACACAASLAIASSALNAQIANNPYKVNYNWDKLEGRKIGVASGIRLDPDGQHLWILDRCGANGCAESTLDPIIQVDMDGKFVRSFGKGIMNFPHGFFIDREGNRLGDRRRAGRRSARRGRLQEGHWAIRSTSSARRQGGDDARRGRQVPGADEKHFNGPTGVVVAAERRHLDHRRPRRTGTSVRTKTTCTRSRGGNNRLVRFSKDGKFIKQWGGGVGSEGSLPLQFNDPHDIEIDGEGRLYIADRGNQRIQVLDKEGNFITRWTQFGKPSAIAVDTKGNIYVADGMSDEQLESRLGARHPHRRSQDRAGSRRSFPTKRRRAAPAPSSSASTRAAGSSRARAAGLDWSSTSCARPLF